MTQGQQKFLTALLRDAGLPVPEYEVRFAPPRKWRADALWQEQQLCLEVDGGAFLPGGGRHTRGAGWLKDGEKLNMLAVLGYRVLRLTPKQLLSTQGFHWIHGALITPPPSVRLHMAVVTR